jgi:hypothetical protein
LAVIAIRGKQLSIHFCFLLFLMTSSGSGLVQYFLSRGLSKAERLSAAHMIGVSSLRLNDDAKFVRDNLVSSSDASLNWVGTFKMKAADISVTIEAVELNDFVRRYYSVYESDLHFHRNQLDRAAVQVVEANEGANRQSSVHSYLKGIELVIDQLERMAQEMRKQGPESYYW